MASPCVGLAMLDDLNSVREDINTRLMAAAGNRRLPMHTPVVATADADARIMVIRHFDPDNWVLRFHTDSRSPKAAEIGANAPVGVLFYDAGEKVQIRCRGRGRIETDGPNAQAAWEESTAFARRCYLGAAPGEIRPQPSSGLPEWAEGTQPAEEDLIPARENFAVLLVTVETAEWYCLANSGHRRARLTRENGTWLTP